MNDMVLIINFFFLVMLLVDRIDLELEREKEREKVLVVKDLRCGC